MYYYGARWYDAYLNRWIQPDTIIPEDLQGVQAWDRMAYVNNNPINRIDPSGNWSFTVGYNVSAIVNSTLNIMLNYFGFSSTDVAMVLDTSAVALDTAALAIDSTIAAGDIVSATIGATAGAGFAAPEGGAPVVVTGPAGAAVGMGIFELSVPVRAGLVVGNALASLATASTAVSDVITGDTNDIVSITLSDNGIQYNRETMIGRNTLTSIMLSVGGFISPIGITSTPVQLAALVNDLGWLYIGPLEMIPESILIRDEELTVEWE